MAAVTMCVVRVDDWMTGCEMLRCRDADVRGVMCDEK